MSDHRFLDLAVLLDPSDLIVVNNTRVRAARLHGVRADTGGRIELLLLESLDSGWWSALARPARRLGPGVRLRFDELEAVVRTQPVDGEIALEFETHDLEQVLPGLGEMPLPPYFHGKLSDEDRYQTIFAEEPGSAAAPTAGLHFTEDVIGELARRGIQLVPVDLHVSLDTFRPIATGSISNHRMHSEWCSIPKDTAAAIADARRRGGRVIAVGTTVVRTLESRALDGGVVEPGGHRTDLFLKPGDPFHVVDGLITNFHLPASTLLVLLAAFMGDGWRRAYEIAIDRGYRFLSFGDSMFAVRS